MWGGLKICMKARRVMGNVVVRTMPNGRMACKANTIFIAFPTKIIPRVVLLVSDSCNQSRRNINRARQIRSQSCVSNPGAPPRRRGGYKDVSRRRRSRSSSRKWNSDKLEI
jgi:hypothetical protein